MALHSISRLNKIQIFGRCSSILQLCKSNITQYPYRPPENEPGSFPFLKRRVPPKGIMSLEARLAEMKASQAMNSDLMEPINIGLPRPQAASKTQPRVKRRRPAELEAAARTNQLLVPLEEVEKEWLLEKGSDAIVTVAHHYNIFKDLFSSPHFFDPVVQLDLFYPESEAEEGEDGAVFVSPVYFGNTLPAVLAADPPNLRFEAPEFARKAYWTLVMTSPDEHLEESEKEYLHWMVSNIPVDENGFSKISAGELVCPYLPPIPPRGSGYHRYVFVLYHHDDPISFSAESRQDNCSLQERTFSTYDFYRSHEEQITPGGFAFFQSRWDPSVRLTFHQTLDMAEPVFEFEWPREHREPQIPFPQGEAFNKYLDKYRDVKDINEEVLKEKLKLVHPFKDYPQQPKYPHAVPETKKLPSWFREREKQKKLRQGIWKELP